MLCKHAPMSMFRMEVAVFILLALQDDKRRATDEQVALGLEAFREWLGCQACFFSMPCHLAPLSNHCSLLKEGQSNADSWAAGRLYKIMWRIQTCLRSSESKISTFIQILLLAKYLYSKKSQPGFANQPKDWVWQNPKGLLLNQPWS